MHYFSTMFSNSKNLLSKLGTLCRVWITQSNEADILLAFWHTCRIVFFYFHKYHRHSNTFHRSSFLINLCIPFQAYPLSTKKKQKKRLKNWFVADPATYWTVQSQSLSYVFEFPVSISRDRWWGPTLLSKWHSDVLLSTSDWPPFYQPSTLVSTVAVGISTSP